MAGGALGGARWVPSKAFKQKYFLTSHLWIQGFIDIKGENQKCHKLDFVEVETLDSDNQNFSLSKDECQ